MSVYNESRNHSPRGRHIYSDPQGYISFNRQLIIMQKRAIGTGRRMHIHRAARTNGLSRAHA